MEVHYEIEVELTDVIGAHMVKRGVLAVCEGVESVGRRDATKWIRKGGGM